MARNITVGIDVGTYATKVVVSERDREDNHTIIATGYAESEGLRRGYIVNFNEAVLSVRKAILQAEQNARMKIGRAYVSLGGVSLESIITGGQSVVTRGDGEVTELDVKKAIEESEKSLGELKNKRILHTVPLRFKLDGKEITGRAVGLKGMKLEVKTLFVICLEQHFEDLAEVVEAAGVEVTDIVASPLAAGMVALTKRQRNVGSILVNIGAETVSAVVYENDIPISLDVFPLGSTDITNDMALGLKIAPEEAERIKIGKSSGDLYPKKKLDEIIEARLSDIFEIIEAHLKKIGRNGLLPGGIILTGGGSGIATIDDLAKAALKLPTKVFGREVVDLTKGRIKDSSWFVAYGLSMLSGEGSAMESAGVFRDLRRFLSKIGDFLTSSGKQLLP